MADEIAALLLEPIAEYGDMWIGPSRFRQISEVASRRESELWHTGDILAPPRDVRFQG
jgi:hypothetical protein